MAAAMGSFAMDGEVTMDGDLLHDGSEGGNLRGHVFKRTLCNFWKAGFCSNGENCTWSHGGDDAPKQVCFRTGMKEQASVLGGVMSFCYQGQEFSELWCYSCKNYCQDVEATADGFTYCTRCWRDWHWPQAQVAAKMAQVAAKMEPGDWQCPTCGDIQFARKTACKWCSTPNPDPGRNAARSAKQDWLCRGPYSCGKPNDMADVKCSFCGEHGNFTIRLKDHTPGELYNDMYDFLNKLGLGRDSREELAKVQPKVRREIMKKFAPRFPKNCDSTFIGFVQKFSDGPSHSFPVSSSAVAPGGETKPSGQTFDVVLDGVNIGMDYGRKVNKTQFARVFEMEGVVKAYRFYKETMGLQPIVVMKDKRKYTKHIGEYPPHGAFVKVPGDADEDDMKTLILACKSNCQFVSKDTYNDWPQKLEERGHHTVKDWFEKNKDEKHVEWMWSEDEKYDFIPKNKKKQRHSTGIST